MICQDYGFLLLSPRLQNIDSIMVHNLRDEVRQQTAIWTAESILPLIACETRNACGMYIW
jgi:hypothetical protein